MIGLIGFEDDIIGFGLAGIDKMIEVPKKPAKEIVVRAFENLLTEGIHALIIRETLTHFIAHHAARSTVVVIEIPEQFTAPNLDELERITRETLGISIE